MLKVLLYLVMCLMCLEAKIKVAVSIEPQDFFVHKIGGDLVETYVLVPSKKNPENYEPLLSQMIFLKDAQLYLGIGIEFERQWKERFISANPKMKFFDITTIQEKTEDINVYRGDQHLWLSVKFAYKQAKKIAELLSNIDPRNEKIYQKNLKVFLQEIKKLDLEIKNIFSSSLAKKDFLVFHPAFEYFAKEYGLREWAIDKHNKEAKIKHLQEINQLIKKQKLQVIYVQPQFSKRQVELLAKNHQLKISILDPFAPQWDKNLLEMAKKIAHQE